MSNETTPFAAASASTKVVNTFVMDPIGNGVRTNRIRAPTGLNAGRESDRVRPGEGPDRHSDMAAGRRQGQPVHPLGEFVARQR